MKLHNVCGPWKPCLLRREKDRRTILSLRLEFSLPLLLAVTVSSLPIALADVASVTDVAQKLLRSR